MLECCRCDRILVHGRVPGVDRPLAWLLTSLLFLTPAALWPLLTLTSFGIRHSDALSTGPQMLWADGFWSLSSVVLLFSIVLPFVYLGLTTWVLLGIRNRSTAPLGRLFRWSCELRPWMMLEVYLVGCCVAYSRLESVGSVGIGIGGWCLIAAAVAAILASLALDESRIWRALATTVPRTIARPSLACQGCGLMLAESHEGQACPRCRIRVRRRKPEALSRTLALVVTGFLLYIPANLMPVLTIDRFGKLQPNTILTGVHELILAGLWPLAVIVFTASVLVPLLKLFGLSGMLLLTYRRSGLWLRGRTRLYRLIDLIGRWSSIDLFMISILVALVRFGALTSVRAEPGAVAFAAVVVITMFASRCFDPRLMWDHAEEAT